MKGIYESLAGGESQMGIWPQDGGGSNPQDAIIYKKNKFEKIAAGEQIWEFTGSEITNPIHWIQMQIIFENS